MENIEATGGSSEAVETETPSTGTQDGGDAQPTPADGSQPGTDNQPGDEGNAGQDDQFVIGEDGKKYIPEDAFNARIAKLSSQKNDARSLLESIRTDPVIRKEFMDSLNQGEARTTSATESNEPSAFDKFLAPLPPEHQAHYRGLIEAIAPQFEEYVTDALEKAVGPIRSWIGESKVDSFAKANPDFAHYKKDVSEIIQSGRAKSLEDAFKIAAFDKKLKSVTASSNKSEAERQAKLKRVPVAGQGQGAVQTVGKKPTDLRSALQKAASDIGWAQ